MLFDNKSNKPYLGTGPAAERVKWNICAAAAANCAVLIRGETGTGKGVAASRIHDLSPRKDQPFVAINCAGLSGELLKSELFGHAKGSFTGAVNDRTGLIEEADGGTLFLDEIGDMDQNVQCLLLKAIEERRFRRIGENWERSSGFRLICATNRDLTAALRGGTFRQDLFYRINTFTISLPPLRKRTEEIAAIMAHILKGMGHTHPLCEDVVNALTQYPWPGNIRELRNAAERALIFAKDAPLTAAHFAGLGDDGVAEAAIEAAMQEAADGSTGTWAAAGSGTAAVKDSELAVPADGLMDEVPADPDDDPVWSLEALKNHQILRAAKHFNGDRVAICNALNISVSTLHRRLQKILGRTTLEEWLKGGGKAEED